MSDAGQDAVPPSNASNVALAIGTFAVAVAVAVWVVHPFDVGPVGSDSTSTVLYFQRIVSGERLELFLGTAPKPLLSLVYGPLYSVFGDWRAISWLAIVVYALAITCSALLAARVASRAAAAFTAAGMLASTGLLQDVSLAYSVSWALLGWSLAGLAATATPARYGLAGLALMLAGLARPETWLISLLAGLWILGAWFRARAGSGDPPPRQAWLVVVLGLLAIPIQALHDWLLTRDPLYSFATPGLGTVIRAPQDPATVPNILFSHLHAAAPLVILALVGVAVLAVRRSWPMLIGLAALGPGTAAFLLYLGWRNTYVLDRYALPVDLAIIFGAGVGFAALAVPILTAALESRWMSAARHAAHLAVAAGVAVAVAPSVAPLDAAFMGNLRADRQLVVNFQRAAPAIEHGLETIPGIRDMPSARDPSDVTTPANASLLVPARVYPMAAVQFGLPLTQIARLQFARVSADGSYPSPGQIVLHDQAVDGPADRFGFLEVGQPATSGAVRVVPLLADPDRGVWVVRIEPAT